ncbi:hypothetical protein NC796_09500 [Aliifodinibius sp. S!AR15-10]|uniref:hypothetical protein n=1 Tax=Aliifodinibius sp. S!AR15-10 TaxID=2950437 RepID=UPI00285B5F68|nr:hypothetical protein [Aliifodinibius sp. S!AR15-10]MDR8391372.1 hypothetical protein [Aliifodinibius sp. S!AR15-10]
MEILFLLILVAIAIYWWIKTGNKGKRLYEEIEQELTLNYGWSSDKAFFVWKRFNKEIVNLHLDGLSGHAIAEILNNKFSGINPEFSPRPTFKQKPDKTKAPSHLEGAKSVISLIDMQMMLISDRNNLPARAKDAYSLGYISGMVDASLSGLGEKDTNKAMAAILYVLEEIFGKNEGSQLFKKVLDLIESKDNKFNLAMSDGGTEFVKFNRGDINAPHGWLNYVQDYQ